MNNQVKKKRSADLFFLDFTCRYSTFISESQSLSVSAPAGHLDHTVSKEHFHLEDSHIVKGKCNEHRVSTL